MVPAATRSQTATRSLRLSVWRRSRDCVRRRQKHLRRLDGGETSREDIILTSVLAEVDIAIERNLFPYDLPAGIEHWTLWSRLDMSQFEMEQCVSDWLAAMNGSSTGNSVSSAALTAVSYPAGARPAGNVLQWNFDSNAEDRSINLYHIHVFLSTNSSRITSTAHSHVVSQVPAGLPRRWSQLTPTQLADAVQKR
jgi:hypothetical protein